MNISREIKLNQRLRGKRLLGLILMVLFLLEPTVAYAAVYYENYIIVASTSIANTTVKANQYLVASDTAGITTNIKISWELQDGDSITLQNWDGYRNELQSMAMDTSQLSVRERSVTPPSGTFTTGIVLTTSNSDGNRYAWIKEASNSYGHTTIFLDPDIQADPPPNNPPSKDPDLQDIKLQISAVTNYLSTISSDMNSQFNAVKSKLDTISSDLRATKDYITTPRTPPPLHTDPMPSITFDSTLPDMSEPYQQPYNYDRPDPVMPRPVAPPEPLPFAPAPTVIPHEQPRQADQARYLEEPVPRENPRQTEPVIKEPPHQIDPVIKEPPRELDPVHKDPPLTPDSPFGRSNPITADPPFSPQAPFTPEPPCAPESWGE